MGEFNINLEEEYVDGNGVGHEKGVINGKEFHLSGEHGWVDDAKGNLTREEFDALFDELIEGK